MNKVPGISHKGLSPLLKRELPPVAKKVRCVLPECRSFIKFRGPSLICGLIGTKIRFPDCAPFGTNINRNSSPMSPVPSIRKPLRLKVFRGICELCSFLETLASWFFVDAKDEKARKYLRVIWIHSNAGQ